MLARVLAIASTIVVLLAATIATSHQDRVLSLRSDGTIVGLPDRFGASRLTIDKSGNPWIVVVRIGAIELELPECLGSLFQNSPPPLTLAGSWYHDLETLPPYLAISLPQKAGRPDGAVAFDLVLSLKDLSIVDLSMSIALPNGGQLMPDDALSKICSETDLESTKSRPAA